jgi:hypothetical protein
MNEGKNYVARKAFVYRRPREKCMAYPASEARSRSLTTKKLLTKNMKECGAARYCGAN